MLHPIELLFDAMREVAPYPKGVVPFSTRLAGTAFFPGGSGLWGTEAGKPLPPMPTQGVMVLGHDFHSESAFAKSVGLGFEIHSATNKTHVPSWAALTKMLRGFGIDPRRCFFTNAYMGLRKGQGTTGRFPGSRDQEFVDRSRAFLLRQLAAQSPRLVLALGAWVPSFLAPMAPQLSEWLGINSLNHIDRVGPVQHHVQFAAGQPCSVVALTHPSLWGRNVTKRRYKKKFEGVAAEHAMVSEAILESGVHVDVV
jgi:uracil-DNA glycosylase